MHHKIFTPDDQKQTNKETEKKVKWGGGLGCKLMGHKVSSMTTAEISNSFQTVIRGASSWFVHLQKLKPKFVKFTIRYPCQSSPSFFLYGLLLSVCRCFSIFVNDYFQFSFNLKVILYMYMAKIKLSKYIV